MASIQILSGLDEGQKIAASSAFLLDSESRLAEAMGAMTGMPGMSMEGMAGMAGMEGMKMDTPAKSRPDGKKGGDLTLTLSTATGENKSR